MENGAFAFIQAVFHIVLFLVVHASRARNGVRLNHKHNRTLKRKESP